MTGKLPTYPACAAVGFEHNPSDYAASVHCPALLMHGARDPRVSLTEARRVFEAIVGTKEFVTFEQSGHESYLRTNASQWRTVIEGFIKRAENKDPDRYVSRDEDAG